MPVWYAPADNTGTICSGNRHYYCAHYHTTATLVDPACANLFPRHYRGATTTVCIYSTEGNGCGNINNNKKEPENGSTFFISRSNRHTKIKECDSNVQDAAPAKPQELLRLPLLEPFCAPFCEPFWVPFFEPF